MKEIDDRSKSADGEGKGLLSLGDEIRDPGDAGGAGDFETVADIVPERDAVSGAGFHLTEEGVTKSAPAVGSGSLETLRRVM